MNLSDENELLCGSSREECSRLLGEASAKKGPEMTGRFQASVAER